MEGTFRRNFRTQGLDPQKTGTGGNTNQGFNLELPKPMYHDVNNNNLSRQVYQTWEIYWCSSYKMS
jgi:hypothetical protein